VLNPWDALVRVVERATPMGVHFWYGVFSAPHLRKSTLRILDYLARKSQEITCSCKPPPSVFLYDTNDDSARTSRRIDRLAERGASLRVDIESPMIGWARV
jgi:hypothetical protein